MININLNKSNVLDLYSGTGSFGIECMSRGAKKVFFASAAPPVRYPNVYGIDMASKNEFVAHNKTTDEVCQTIGADKLIYQNLEDLIWSVQQGNPDISSFDCSCFDGKYLTKDIDTSYLENIENLRSDKAKQNNITNENSELICNEVD